MTPETLRTRRDALGLSQPALAALLGVNEMTLSRWERGVRGIPPLLDRALRDLERECAAAPHG